MDSPFLRPCARPTIVVVVVVDNRRKPHDDDDDDDARRTSLEGETHGLMTTVVVV